MSPISTVKGLKKCCVSNMIGTEDVLWEEGHKENSSYSDESVDSD
jgi:hypothetical protein